MKITYCKLAQSSAEEQVSSDECPTYDTKQSDGESPVMLELWGMQSTPSVPSPQVHFGVVAPHIILSIG